MKLYILLEIYKNSEPNVNIFLQKPTLEDLKNILCWESDINVLLPLFNGEVFNTCDYTYILKEFNLDDKQVLENLDINLKLLVNDDLNGCFYVSNIIVGDVTEDKIDDGILDNVRNNYDKKSFDNKDEAINCLFRKDKFNREYIITDNACYYWQEYNTKNINKKFNLR